MIAPALLLTFESIAWTSYAERYVYPAAPFWILSLAVYAASSGFDRLTFRMHRWCFLGLSLLIIVMATLTFQRNLVWRTNLALFRDSVEKSPDYKPVYGLYMTALFENGRYDEALQQYSKAAVIPIVQLKYNPNYDLFHVQILIARKELIEAERELDLINRKTNGKEPGVYETYFEFASQMFLKTSDAGEIQRITEKMDDYYDRWYELSKDPMLLYRKGQLLLSLDKKSEAGKLFGKAATCFPENNMYHKFSEKLAGNLTD
jgi:tetratricopeptide (TPR) repeat protein